MRTTYTVVNEIPTLIKECRCSSTPRSDKTNALSPLATRDTPLLSVLTLSSLCIAHPLANSINDRLLRVTRKESNSCCTRFDGNSEEWLVNFEPWLKKLARYLIWFINWKRGLHGNGRFKRVFLSSTIEGN